MTNEEIFSRIDHTLLSPTATLLQLRTLCVEALDYKTASVCIPPYFVKQAHREFPSLNICTVVGFPLGYSDMETKVFETKRALADGANEIDMVVNISAVKNHNFELVMEEISRIKNACGDRILKVIVETCYLNKEEKIMLCKAITTIGADYIKTSTGFGSAGADRDDIRLFAANIGKNVKIKAAGGIKTREDMEDFIRLGCSRIGTSSGVKILLGKK